MVMLWSHIAVSTRSIRPSVHPSIGTPIPGPNLHFKLAKLPSEFCTFPSSTPFFFSAISSIFILVMRPCWRRLAALFSPSIFAIRAFISARSISHELRSRSCLCHSVCKNRITPTHSFMQLAPLPLPPHPLIDTLKRVLGPHGLRPPIPAILSSSIPLSTIAAVVGPSVRGWRLPSHNIRRRRYFFFFPLSRQKKKVSLRPRWRGWWGMEILEYNVVLLSSVLLFARRGSQKEVTVGGYFLPSLMHEVRRKGGSVLVGQEENQRRGRNRRAG